jgi:hypothetical protein
MAHRKRLFASRCAAPLPAPDSCKFVGCDTSLQSGQGISYGEGLKFNIAVIAPEPGFFDHLPTAKSVV